MHTSVLARPAPSFAENAVSPQIVTLQRIIASLEAQAKTAYGSELAGVNAKLGNMRSRLAIAQLMYDRSTDEERRVRALRRELRNRLKDKQTLTVEEARILGIPAGKKFKGGRTRQGMMRAAEIQGQQSPMIELLPGQVDQRDAERMQAISAAWRAQRDVPKVWTSDQVDKRLVEGYEVLIRMPMRTRPASYGSSMPQYRHEWSDLVGRLEEKEVKSARWRLRLMGGVTSAEIDRMDDALSWCGQYLAPTDLPLSKIVALGALWRALGKSSEKMCRGLGMKPRTFYRMRKEGLDLLVAELMTAGVEVR